MQRRSGVGFNWLDDPADTGFRSNSTYGADQFAVPSCVLSASLDWAILRRSEVFRVRTMAGVRVHGVETYIGYKCPDIDCTQLNNLLAGVWVSFWRHSDGPTEDRGFLRWLTYVIIQVAGWAILLRRQSDVRRRGVARVHAHIGQSTVIMARGVRLREEALCKDMTMKVEKLLTEHTAMISVIMIAVGVILMLCARALDAGALRSLLESFGVLFVSVFFISFLYERFLAEKHFAQFRSVMKDQLLEMDNVQSMCSRLGIREIFPNRNDYERKYPLLDLFKELKCGGRVLLVARSLAHFLNKADAIKAALQRGGQIQLAGLRVGAVDPAVAEVCFLKQSDIRTPLEVLKDLVSWVEENKPQGALELRVHNQPLPDSFLLVELQDRNFVVLDMTFGRDLTDKRVFVLEPSTGNLGNDLMNRYNTIWNRAEVYLRICPNGQVKTNELQRLIEQCGSVSLLEPGELPGGHKALVLDEAKTGVGETTLLSEPALAKDWNRPEEDAAWLHLQQAQSS